MFIVKVNITIEGAEADYFHEFILFAMQGLEDKFQNLVRQGWNPSTTK